MFETSKAVMRRLHDNRFATRFFVGSGIDIGAGSDTLGQYTQFFPLMEDCRAWDLKDGDAQLLAGVPDNALDFAHSSHCLEHMHDPREALKNWLRVLRPGGHLVVLVPDEDLYEQGVFPSTFNTDHKWTFTLHKGKSWSAKSVNVLALLGEFADRAQAVKVELLDASFRYGIERLDQTMTPVGECAIEFVLRKSQPVELRRGGRYPGVISTILGVLGYELRRVGSGGEVQSGPGYRPWRDEGGEFEEYYERARPRTLVSTDRCYVLYRLLLQSLHVEGDVWECGVYAGGTAALLAGVLRAQAPVPAKKLYLFDTFEGMPETDPDRDQHVRGDFADTSLESVQSYVGGEPCVYRKGRIPETFAGLESARIAFAHIDVDIYHSVMDSLTFIWPRLSRGGFVVLDDYGFPTCPGARAATDEFFAGRNALPLCLPTAQAVVFKGLD